MRKGKQSHDISHHDASTQTSSPSWFHSFLSHAERLRKTCSMCDVTMSVLDGAGRVKHVAAHSLLLSSASNYLHQHLQSHVSATHLNLEDLNITYSSLETILDLLYGNHLDSISEDVIQAAKVLQIECISNCLLSTSCDSLEQDEAPPRIKSHTLRFPDISPQPFQEAVLIEVDPCRTLHSCTRNTEDNVIHIQDSTVKTQGLTENSQDTSVQKQDTKSLQDNANNCHATMGVSRDTLVQEECIDTVKSLRNNDSKNTILKDKKLPYTCSECGEKFSNRKQFHQHVRNEHSHSSSQLPLQSNHVCAVCNKAFNRPYKLNDHMRSHANSRDFLCTLCGKTFPSNANLYQHSRTHSGSARRKYSCDECGMVYFNKTRLSEHTKAKHETSQSDLLCDFCGKAFSWPQSLRKHVLTHRTEVKLKRFPCDLCQCKFVSLFSLKRHKEKHCPMLKVSDKDC